MKKQYLVIISTILAGILLTGCSRNVVPAGTVVVVRKASGASVIKAKGVYMALGHDKVYFVDTKLTSKSAKLNVLCKDNINMHVEVKWIGSFDVDESTVEIVCEKVPSVKVSNGDVSGFQLSFDKFWTTAMADVVVGAAKKVISPYETDAINVNRDKVEADIKTMVLSKLQEAKYPVKTSDILLVNLDYPPEVNASRKAIKAAELKDLENAATAKANLAAASRDAELALERNKAKLIDAEGDAAANRVRSESLTPNILKLKLYDSLMALAEGPNNTSTIVPYEAITPSLMNSTLVRDAVEISK